MANEQNYIGIAMGLDVTDLKQGLAEAGKQIGKANADFKAAASGMDDWQKSTDGLTAKVKQLDSVLAAQKSKLAGLKAEYEKVAKEQGESSTAARNLYIRMKNQEAVVNSTQKEFNNYSETLKQAKDGTIDLTQATLKAGKAIQSTGDSAEESGSKFGGFAKAVGGGLAAVGGLVAGAVTGFFSLAESTREAREDMAKLSSSFTGAGLSGEAAQSTFTDLYKVIGETDTAVEASQQIALLAKSEEEAAKWAELATGVTATFGDALKPETFYEAANETLKLGEATGAFTQMLEGTGISVEEFNAELATMNTEQERQAYMLEVSQEAMGAAGEAYKETAGSIMEAREAEAQLSLAMQELGAIAEPIMTTLKLVVVDLVEALNPFVELIGNGLTAAFNGSSEGASLLAEGIGGILTTLVEKVNGLIPTLVDVVLQLVPILIESILAQLPSLLQMLIDVSVQLTNMIAQILPQIIDAIMKILPVLIKQLVASIPVLLQAAIQLLMAIVKAIPTIIRELVNALPDIISTIISTLLANLPMILGAAIDLFMAIVDAIPQITIELVRAIPQIITGIVDGLIKGVPDLIDAGKDLLDGLMEGMLNPSAIWKGIKKVGKSIKDGFADFFDAHSPARLMIEDGENIAAGVGVGIEKGIPAIKKNLDAFGSYIKDNLGGIKNGLAVNGAASGSYVGGRTMSGGISSVQNIYYNGNLSRKQIKQLENDNYNSIVSKMKAQGVIG